MLLYKKFRNKVFLIFKIILLGIVRKVLLSFMIIFVLNVNMPNVTGSYGRFPDSIANCGHVRIILDKIRIFSKYLKPLH